MTIESKSRFEDKNNIINRIKENQSLDFEKVANWIVAGSGNYEKTQTDGRYRENCNTFREASTCETHKIKSLKFHYNHCNKLDCETCFLHATSSRARIINRKLLEFKKKATNEGIRVGRIVHLILSPKQEIILPYLDNYEDFLKFKKTVKVLLEEFGLFAGVIVFDLWSKKCEHCGKKEEDCPCSDKKIVRAINPHFHYMGYGYLRNDEEIKSKYNDWVTINTGRRDDAYHTIMYSVSHAALWRKANGKLKPAYHYFGYLRSNKLVSTGTAVKFYRDKCPICKQPRKRITKGLKISGTRPQLRGSHSLLEYAKKKGIKTRKLSFACISKEFKKHIYNDGNLKVEVTERDIELGTVILYKSVLRSYRINDIAELREIVRENKRRYDRDRLKYTRTIQKEANGYG
jgi:hypothetical protein